MTDTVLTYKGRPVADLTKNELVDAMTWAFQEIEYQRERADRLLNAATLAETEPQRRCLYSPVQIAECGGPCEQGPEHCDCGELCATEPEPEGPTDEELCDLMYEFTIGTGHGERLDETGFARAVLARWGK